MRRILQFFMALALVVAPFGSGAVWADQHEKKGPSEASDSKEATSETPSEASTSKSATSSMASPAPAATKEAMQAVPTGPVNINTANAEELQTLPNIGPKKAQAIIDYRKENGEFKSIGDLKNVSGIGDKTFSGLEQFLKL
jgi:competence protein ComEA